MKEVLIALFVWGVVCLGAYPIYAQEVPTATALKTSEIDVNKDGHPDITYYSDTSNIVKIEADTNYDGKPDVTVYTENGKLKSAEADTNYDGIVEEKFSDATGFNDWLNKNKSDFKDLLNQESLNKTDLSDNKFKF
jgi:hypothetical protein